MIGISTEYSPGEDRGGRVRMMTNAEKQRAYRERCKANASNVTAAPLPSNIPALKRWRGMVSDASELLARVQEEMQSWIDDRSDDWQESEKADVWQDRLDALEEALDVLSNVTEG